MIELCWWVEVATYSTPTAPHRTSASSTMFFKGRTSWFGSSKFCTRSAFSYLYYTAMCSCFDCQVFMVEDALVHRSVCSTVWQCGSNAVVDTVLQTMSTQTKIRTTAIAGCIVIDVLLQDFQLILHMNLSLCCHRGGGGDIRGNCTEIKCLLGAHSGFGLVWGEMILVTMRCVDRVWPRFGRYCPACWLVGQGHGGQTTRILFGWHSTV